ncbi:PfkB family carbohydrate kinase [Nocardiopsis deserti]|uniref:PfkB family carbohydrate kinase n=1 Tax=Nocardiopsis deserti TaxID=2605988 RepID=UPI00123BC78E|nr:PfkB family carbohydrate kinase [Nocardiopsis deserti]
MSKHGLDVVVLGEVLLEVATDAPVAHGVPARLGVSGDALNVAAAASRAGARVGLAAVLTDDELGRAVADRVAELGVSTDMLRFRPGQQGVYLVHSDPEGERAFSYARTGSVGSTLSPEDLDEEAVGAAGAVVAGGIACAVSDSARRAVLAAARLARRFVFDPNHRPRLASREEGAATLAELARHAYLVTPSHPGETSALLDSATPAEAARRLLEAGARNVAVTCGSRGVHLATRGEAEGRGSGKGDSEASLESSLESSEGFGKAHPEGAWEESWIDAVPAPRVLDQTGAGDVFVGTLTARLTLGDPLAEAARLAAAAASLSVGGRGGTGFLPTLEQTRAHAREKKEETR